jgi:chromosome segregation ATPase
LCFYFCDTLTESTLQTEQSTNSALRSQLQQKSAELQQLHQQHSMLAQSFELSLVQHQQDKQQLQNRAEQSVKQLTLTFQVELDSLRQKEQSWRAKWDELQHSAVGVHQDLAALQVWNNNVF